MAGLSDSQIAVIRTLVETAPDAAIRSLDLALASEPRTDTAMSAIRDMVSVEAGERRARTMVFSPVLALCPRSEPAFNHPTFPPRTLALLWRGLKQSHPGKIVQAASAGMNWGADEASPEVFDELCLIAADGLLGPEAGPFAPAVELLGDEAEDFAGYLKLAPIAREAQARLPEWLGRMTGERAAHIRLAFKDANASLIDARPRLFEMLLSGLEEPWLILRVISAMMDRPSDQFLAGSELGDIGERVLADIDRRLDDVSAFDPYGGAQAGIAAAEAVRIAVAEISELEHALDLRKDSPWGKRVLRQKQTLAQKAEALLSRVDLVVGEALPLKKAKFGRGTRGVPSFKADPDPRAVTRAEGMLTFLERVRGAASAGGYTALRNKAVEKLDDRFDTYVEDVLDHLRAPDAETPERARAFLAIAANLIALYQDEKSAQIVRRRAAA